MMVPAVAVMAKVPGLEPVKSRLQPALTPELATLVYRCFLLDRLDGVAALPQVAPVLAFTPAHGRRRMEGLAPGAFRLVAQTGAGLGERLSNLLAGLVADGHPGAIAMDSDSPTLPMAYVVEAAETLAAGAADMVVGPSEDGGYYLIGLRQRHAALFSDMPWSTDQVLELTLARARRLGLRVHQLPEWFDVDTESDLRRLALDLDASPGPAGPWRTRRCLESIYV
jgi:rSAM/selenodomain-associated transferase 1